MLPFAVAVVNIYWLALPPVVAISLVYAASRHESWPRIFWHALKLGSWILGLMVLTMAILLAINTQV